MPVIYIDNDGVTKGLSSPVTRLLQLSDRQRVSHVEPVDPILRRVFHTLRRRVPDESRLAEFTRRWPCQWQAHIIDGPVLGPFGDRQAAINAEIEFLNSRIEGESNVQAIPDAG